MTDENCGDDAGGGFLEVSSNDEKYCRKDESKDKRPRMRSFDREDLQRYTTCSCSDLGGIESLPSCGNVGSQRHVRTY